MTAHNLLDVKDYDKGLYRGRRIYCHSQKRCHSHTRQGFINITEKAQGRGIFLAFQDFGWPESKEVGARVQWISRPSVNRPSCLAALGQKSQNATMQRCLAKQFYLYFLQNNSRLAASLTTQRFEKKKEKNCFHGYGAHNTLHTHTHTQQLGSPLEVNSLPLCSILSWLSGWGLLRDTVKER